MSEPIIHMVVERKKKSRENVARCGFSWQWDRAESKGHGITVWDDQVTCPTCRGEK